MATVKPPTPPKSSAPSKSIPKSQEKLDARDDKKPKAAETEEKKTGGSGTSEEPQEKEEGEKKEGEEKDKDKKEGEEGEEDEDEEEEDEDEEEEESVEVVGGGLLNLSTIWGAIFFIIFFLIDAIGLTLVICGVVDDLWISDVIGLIFYAAWQFIYKNFYGGSGEMTAALEAEGRIKMKAQKGLSKLLTGKWSKFLIPLGGEVIPVLGQIVPFWTISFLVQIKNS